MTSKRPLVLFLVLLALVHNISSLSAAPLEKWRLRWGLDWWSASGVSRQDLAISFTVWVERLGPHLGYELDVTTKIFEERREITGFLREGTVDIVFIGAVNFLDYGLGDDLEPFLTVDHTGRGGNEYVLLTKNTASKPTLASLQGKRLLIHQGGSGRLPECWLRALLREDSLPEPVKHFASMKRPERASRCVHGVFFDEADCAVIARNHFETMCELNPQLSAQLTVVRSSPLLAETIACFRHGLDADHRNAFLSKVWTIGDYPSGKQILMLFKVQRLTPFKESHLDGVRQLIERGGMPPRYVR